MKKRFLVLALSFVLVFALTACGGNEPAAEQNAIADLYANAELTAGMTSCSEGVWKGVFYTEDYSEVQLAVANMTDEEYEAYEAIDFADDDAEDQQKAIVFKVADVTITDIKDKVPTQETLDSWIGKKCQDLVDAGFYDSGNTCDPDDPSTLELFYDGPDYCVAVGFGKDFKTNYDDLSPNDILKLTIKSVRMTALGSGLVE